jgi:hypothetical protein
MLQPPESLAIPRASPLDMQAKPAIGFPGQRRVEDGRDTIVERQQEEHGGRHLAHPEMRIACETLEDERHHVKLAFAYLAVFAREGMEGPQPYLRLRIFEQRDEIRERLRRAAPIEVDRTPMPDVPVGILESLANRRQRGVAERLQSQQRLDTRGRDRERCHERAWLR